VSAVECCNDSRQQNDVRAVKTSLRGLVDATGHSCRDRRRGVEVTIDVALAQYTRATTEASAKSELAGIYATDAKSLKNKNAVTALNMVHSVKDIRYWRQPDGDVFCGRYPEVSLDELAGACALIHGSNIDTGRSTNKFALINTPKNMGALALVAMSTPACWVLEAYGATRGMAYVIVDEDFGEAWSVYVTWQGVYIECAKWNDGEQLKEVLDRLETAGAIALIRIKESTASIVNML